MEKKGRHEDRVIINDLTVEQPQRPPPPQYPPWRTGLPPWRAGRFSPHPSRPRSPREGERQAEAEAGGPEGGGEEDGWKLQAEAEAEEGGPEWGGEDGMQLRLTWRVRVEALRT